ncbi:MAG TPA: hypothetical protein DCQ50_04395, partial [Chryseobacterium sp.]|nr:hypothetical protein [Chryseobacterium sp.]
MEQLENLVEFYLKNESNYAFLITGEWGVGKTYFFKNTLESKIANIQCYHNPEKKYKPILISLFGKKSIEEIQTEIFISFYPLFKKKAVKLTLSTCKSLARGIMNVTGVGELKDYISDFEINSKDYVDFREIVLCFDDLERKSDNLRSEEVIGFINSLVETNKTKIIIIANQEKIENFSDLKEKVIGNTIEFLPEMKKNFDSLVIRLFSGDQKYIEFLFEYKYLILETFGSKNLRTLGFILTYLRKIYLEVIEELKSQKALYEIIDEVLKTVIRFTTSVGLEYKLDNISFSDKQKLDNDPTVWSIFASTNNYNSSEKKKKEFVEIFIEKYYKGERYHFFSSIYNFLTGGMYFDVKNLVVELKELYGIKDDEIQPQYKIFNSLGYPKVFSLTEKEYITNTKRLLKYVDFGTLNLADYLTAFYFIGRFGNPLNLDLERVKKRVIKGMKKGQYCYTENLNMYLSNFDDTEFKNFFVEMREEVIKINEKSREEERKGIYNELEKLCYLNFEKFSDKVFDVENEIFFQPIFSNFSTYNFYR